jgi:hypothetical protein
MSINISENHFPNFLSGLSSHYSACLQVVQNDILCFGNMRKLHGIKSGMSGRGVSILVFVSLASDYFTKSDVSEGMLYAKSICLGKDLVFFMWIYCHKFPKRKKYVVYNSFGIKKVTEHGFVL